MACQAPWPKGLEFLTISLPYSRRNSQEPALSKRGSWLGLRGVKGPARAPTAKKWQGSEWTWPWGSSLASASLRDVGGLLRAETRRQTGLRLLPPLRQTKQQRAARLGVPSSRLLSAGAWLHRPRRAPHCALARRAADRRDTKVEEPADPGSMRPPSGPSGISLVSSRITIAADTQALTASQLCGAGRGLGPHGALSP